MTELFFLKHTQSAMPEAPRRAATLHPPPAYPENLAPLTASLDLTLLPLGNNIFTNVHPLWIPTGARGIYGGSVIAQSLLAAIRTTRPPAVKERVDEEGQKEEALMPHSLHCYFVLAGNPKIPVVYHSKDLRTGRSFATRGVEARQGDKTIFVASVSFNKRVGLLKENVVRHQAAIPKNIPRADEIPSEVEKVERALELGKITEEVAAGWRRKIAKDVFEWRQLPLDWDANTPLDQRTVRYWARLKDGRGMSEEDHLVSLAYMSDSWFIGTVTRTNPAAHWNNLGMMVSLDHSMHFHHPPRTDRWMLAEMTAPWAGEERALVQMKIWNEEGQLLATCSQEGLLRLRDGREGEAFAEEEAQEKLEQAVRAAKEEARKEVKAKI